MNTTVRPLPRRARWLAALPASVLLSVLLASCGGGDGGGGPTDPPPPPPPTGSATPAAITAAGGDAQTGTVAAQLGTPLTVRVTDAGGAAVPGASVTFRVVSGGTLSAGTASTGADGLASTRWTLGTAVADSQVVEASVQGASAPLRVRFRATPLAGAAGRVAASLDSVAFQAVGDSVRVLATVADAYGNPTTGEPRFRVSDFSVVEVDSMTGWIRSRGDGTARVVVVAGTGTDTVPVRVTQAVNRLVAGVDSVRMTAIGDTVQLSATLYDANGNAVSSVIPGWVLLEGNAVALAGGGQVVAVAPGVARVAAVAGSRADTVRVRVEQVPVRIAATVPSLRFTAVGDTARLAATAADRRGNLIAGVDVTWTLEEQAEEVVTLHVGGLLVSRSNGERRVFAAVGELRDTVPVQVEQLPVRMAGLPDSVRFVSIGDTLTLRAAVFDRRGSPIPGLTVGMGLRFADTTGLALRAGGLLVAKAPEAINFVYLSHGTLRDTVRVHMLQRVARVEVVSPVDSLSAGSYATMSYRAADARGNPFAAVATPTVAWESATPSVASALGTTSGRFQGLADGTAQVRVTVNGVVGSLGLRVHFGLGLQRTRTSIAAGYASTCGLTAAGVLHCWGQGYGTGTPRVVATPEPLATLSAGLATTCGLAADGTAYCWGTNYAGQVGDGTTTTRSAPVPVSTSLRFAAIASGGVTTCGLTASGAAYCWGGNTGDGTTSTRSTPVPVSGGRAYVALAAGSGHVCALASNREVFCWGENLKGQLGDGTTTRRLVPTRVSGSETYASIFSGGSADHTCGYTTSGALSCWGSNLKGQMGAWAAVTHHVVPVQQARSAAVARLSAGETLTCLTNASVVDGSAATSTCMGSDASGQLGNDGTAPVLSLGLVQVSAGGSHACGISMNNNNAVYCWGRGIEGQAGSSASFNPAPVRVGTLSFDTRPTW